MFSTAKLFASAKGSHLSFLKLLQGVYRLEKPGIVQELHQVTEKLGNLMIKTENFKNLDTWNLEKTW